MNQINLSEKEKALLNLIKTSSERVTIEVIKKVLGKEYVGALGRLTNNNLVEMKKKFVESDTNPWGRVKVKHYIIKEN